MRGIGKGTPAILDLVENFHSSSCFLDFAQFVANCNNTFARIFFFIFFFRTKWTRKADSFDARTIFKQYGSEDWGDYVIHEAHLSQRFAYDDNGYYHCCASIPFPVNMQAD